ncbi:protein-disulfide reductase DsbD [Rhodocyclus purpureus]|uniref:protein-disulfide reductase DsbD n=1 Tax=Rhodocyclus purpureus TaxID=1067 RepID=UPI001912AEE9|nr:protein-disulfide reductase DsbD [Rhodocyclus purpureus]MBK5914057.1 thiol:disulfide interchange protein [Rhodocyclus purpureus]
MSVACPSLLLRAARFVAVLCTLLFVAVTAGAQEFLDPAVAFKPSARALDGGTIEVRFEIARGYYLYRDKLRFKASPESVTLGPARLPPGKEKVDETFGRVEVYFREARILLPVERSASGAQPITLAVTSQGCAEAGICYPPQQQVLTLELPPPAPGDGQALATANDDGGDESGRIAELLRGASFWAILASFFGFGLLLALTPCMLPMLPILSGIIVGSRAKGAAAGRPTSRGRAFALSLAYVLGMAVTYAAAGVAAGLTGTLLSTALQTPWALGGFALIFVVLAGAMFGFYELQLPSALQSRASAEASHLRGGSLPGVAAMGALSALIVGPCVAAPLAGALLYIGQTGDALLGGAALFAMALGMGVPLLAVGLSAGTLLPKAGPWMVLVNKAFGVILLGVAVWLVSPLLPPSASLAAWGVLLIVPAVYLHALDPLPAHARGGKRVAKGAALVLLLYGVALVVGALSGARDPWQPLAGLRGSVAEAPRLPFVRVASNAELDARLAEAAARGQPAMLDFYADWCITCKEMERDSFADPRVHERLSGWLLLQADVTANSADDAALLKRFQLYGPPGIIFFDRSGKEIAGRRVVGYQDAPTFLKSLRGLD